MAKMVSPDSSRWYVTGQTDWRCQLDDGGLLLVRAGRVFGEWRWSVLSPEGRELAYDYVGGLAAAKGAAAREAARRA